MKPYRKSFFNNKILFIHIPKTAGATFRSLLLRNYRRKESFEIHDLYPELSLEFLRNLSEEELSKYKMIAGHGAQYLLPNAKDFRSIVFIRDPVDQIISSYYHIKRSLHNKLHPQLEKINDLNGYYEFLKRNDGFNLQTLYLARDEQDFITKKRFMRLNQENYDKAIEILEKIDYVFLTEYFDESLYIMRKEFDLKHLYYTYKNRSSIRKSGEKHIDLLPKIRDEQYWDNKLYQYAKQRYQELKSRYLLEIDQEVEKFKLINKIYSNTIGRTVYLNDRIINAFYGYFKIKPSWKLKPVYDSEDQNGN